LPILKTSVKVFINIKVSLSSPISGYVWISDMSDSYIIYTLKISRSFGYLWSYRVRFYTLLKAFKSHKIEGFFEFESGVTMDYLEAPQLTLETLNLF